LKKIILVIFIIFLSLKLFCYGTVEKIQYKGSLAFIGMSLYFDKNYDQNFLSLCSYGLNPGPINKIYSIQINSNFIYNLQKKYFDFLIGYDLLYYPFNQIFSINLIYDFSFGLLCLNNYTHLIEIGLNFDIPIINENNIYINTTVYLRQSWKIFGYLYNNDYYQSNFGQKLAFGYRMYFY